MKRPAFLSIMLLQMALLFCLGACGDRAGTGSGDRSGPPPATSEPGAAAFGIGLPAPDFTLQDIHGQAVSLSAHRGKAVVVDFWATWCGPCRVTMPHLQSLVQQYPDQLAVLAISLDQNPQAAVPPFAARMGLTFPLLADPKGVQVAQQWGGVRQIPTAYLVDPEGVVVEKWIGAKSPQEYEERIRRVLGLDT